MGKVSATTRHYYYARTYSQAREIYFSDGSNSSDLRNPTREAAVIVHEYMHIVSETFNPLTQQDKAEAMDEGYSDFFSITYRHEIGGVSSTIFGEYVDVPNGDKYYREVDNDAQLYQFGENIDGGPGVSYHDGGMILSGALWDFYTHPDVTGEYEAVKVVLNSLAHLDNNPDFYDAREAMIAACSATATEHCTPAVKDAFAAHGIGSPSGSNFKALPEKQNVPDDFVLEGNAPNPFSDMTTIHYAIPEQAHVNLSVYDVLGRRVRVLVDEMKPAGYYPVVFSAGDLPSGVYFIRMQADEFSVTKRMMLVR